MGNPFLGGTREIVGTGQTPNDSIVKIATFVSVFRSAKVSLWLPRFWIATLTLPVWLGLLSVRLIFLGGLIVRTVRLCVAAGAPCTMTLKLQVLVFPEVFTAVPVTVFVPSGKTDPDAGEQ